MATVKQTKEMWKKIDQTLSKLEILLHRANDMGVIKYDKTKWQEESPAEPLCEIYGRFNKTTEAVLAEAMRRELRGQK